MYEQIQDAFITLSVSKKTDKDIEKFFNAIQPQGLAYDHDSARMEEAIGITRTEYEQWKEELSQNITEVLTKKGKHSYFFELFEKYSRRKLIFVAGLSLIEMLMTKELLTNIMPNANPNA
jgi:hypothetical protein